MKNLEPHTINPNACRDELTQFQNLLCSKSEIKERTDILPFFKSSKNLSMLLSSYFRKLRIPDTIAHEYEIDGDFVADLLVGDSKECAYLLVEFEDGTPESIFKKKKQKATPEWAHRFEAAYSQLIDWLWKLEDKRSTADFTNTFGDSRASFQGLIVIGKDMKLSRREEDRLKWRIERTKIDSNSVEVVSFDELAKDMDFYLRSHHGA